jgi:hypothetical protein
MVRRRAKWAIAAALGAGMLFPASGQATVTIGSNLDRAPNNTAAGNQSAFNTILPASYQAPGGLTSPVNGTVVTWNIRAAGVGGSTGFQVFRPLGGGLYTGAGSTPVFAVPPNGISSFQSQVPIKVGDHIGARNDGSFGGLQFVRNDPATEVSFFIPALQDNGPGRAPTTQSFEDSVNAVIEPSNTVTIGATTRNKKKGTATVAVEVPNPGDLSASGKGAKIAGGALTSKAVPRGIAQLLVKAKGKKKAKLFSTGKVKLTLNVTFTPTDGTAKTVTTKVKLKKKL